MSSLLAQTGFFSWSFEPGSLNLKIWIFLGLFFASAIALGLSFAPTRARKPIVVGFTFISGLFFVLYYLWPQPVSREATDLPRGAVEGFGFWLSDALPHVAKVANILTVFLLGLGIFSLMRIHLVRLFKKQKDWFFSLVLILSMGLMIGYGYADWNLRQFNDPEQALELMENWGHANYGFDLLFNGLLQQMDAAMFSMIAFFILSAAYRAFRIRSVEATVLMASALIMILSIMGAFDTMFNGLINMLPGAAEPGSFWDNVRLTTVSEWIKAYLQVPSLRALEFGVGLGALAMGLRIWLGLEKGGVSA